MKNGIKKVRIPAFSSAWVEIEVDRVTATRRLHFGTLTDGWFTGTNFTRPSLEAVAIPTPDNSQATSVMLESCKTGKVCVRRRSTSAFFFTEQCAKKANRIQKS
jgi:hypothetical protein